ncbi:hypothetical protein ACQY0O_000468 [Thecaphora frezii]
MKASIQFSGALFALLLAIQQACGSLSTFDKIDQSRSLLSESTERVANASSLVAFFSEHKSEAVTVDPVSRLSPLEARQGSNSCSTSYCTSSYSAYQACPDTTMAFLSCFCLDSGLDMATCYANGCSIKSTRVQDVTLLVLEACILYLEKDYTSASNCLLSGNGNSVVCRSAAKYAGGGAGFGGSLPGSGSVSSLWSASATATPSAWASAAAYPSSTWTALQVPNMGTTDATASLISQASATPQIQNRPNGAAKVGGGCGLWWTQLAAGITAFAALVGTAAI